MTVFDRRLMGRVQGKSWVPTDRIGLVPGTMVETPNGFCDCEDLGPGMEVFIAGGGVAEVMDIEHPPRKAVEGRAAVVSAGVLGNDAELRLAVTQLVLIKTGPHAELVGASCALVPVGSLIGLEGFAPGSLACDHLVTPVFEMDVLVFAQSGALLFCPGLMPGAVSSLYPTLDDAYGRQVVTELWGTRDCRIAGGMSLAPSD